MTLLVKVSADTKAANCQLVLIYRDCPYGFFLKIAYAQDLIPDKLSVNKVQEYKVFEQRKIVLAKFCFEQGYARNLYP